MVSSITGTTLVQQQQQQMLALVLLKVYCISASGKAKKARSWGLIPAVPRIRLQEAEKGIGSATFSHTTVD